MDTRRATVALWLAAATAPAWAAPAGPDNKAVDPPQAVFRGATRAVRFDISPPLRSIPPVPIETQKEKREDDDLWGTAGPFGPRDEDLVCQKSVGAGEVPELGVSFDAFTNACNCSPPDSDGDVGPNHYVVMVNLHFAIYTKTGTQVMPPTPNNTLWSGFGGPCQTTNAGDPVVLHDQLADRWIFTQFTNPGPPFFNCFAISTTPDPAGPYFRYQIPVPSNVLPDYPKWGIWPDGYYLSTREVGAGIIGAYALDRAAALAGSPTPQIISFAAPVGGQPNGGDGLLPSDLDGTILPPPGSSNYYVGTMDQGGPYGATQDAATFWRFHADFATPANSTFTLTNTIPLAAFTSVMPAPCSSSRQCIPQPSTTNRIDHLGYRQRPTFRLAYRNFGTHESLVTNLSVDAGTGMSGIRWFELRDVSSATPTVFQQGTYAPGTTDGIHRWMGSIAMDRAGNMAIGYSASSATVFPSVRYTGRLVTDPLGTMNQGEGVIHAGTGSQTGSARWGDYTALTVDPVDDCTFWYVNQYIPTTSANGWRIRVGSFRFPAPQCVPVPVELQSFEIKD